MRKRFVIETWTRPDQPTGDAFPEQQVIRECELDSFLEPCRSQTPFCKAGQLVKKRHRSGLIACMRIEFVLLGPGDGALLDSVLLPSAATTPSPDSSYILLLPFTITSRFVPSGHILLFVSRVLLSRRVSISASDRLMPILLWNAV
jgi:hypothetical protein